MVRVFDLFISISVEARLCGLPQSVPIRPFPFTKVAFGATEFFKFILSRNTQKLGQAHFVFDASFGALIEHHQNALGLGVLPRAGGNAREHEPKIRMLL